MSDELLQYFYQALEADLGVVLKYSGDFDEVRQKLYRVRQKAEDPQLDAIQIRRSAMPDEVLLINSNKVEATRKSVKLKGS